MGISIQYHAAPAENADFCIEVQRKFEVFAYGLVSLHSKPQDLREIPVSDLVQYRRILFSAHPLQSMEGGEEPQGYGRNDALVLEIGPLTQAGLKESWLTSTASGDIEKVWRRAVKLMKDRTEAGAYAVNPQTAARVFIRNHRFSPGAQEMAASGVAMLPVAGSAVYQFEG